MKPILMYETVHGSRAYNLERPDSDTDYKGIIVGPTHWYHGYRGGPEQIEKSADHVHYEIRKFFRLMASSNPTVIEMPWTEPEDHRTVTVQGERLLQTRQSFLTKRTRWTFAGYALSQLKRIKTHRRWLLSPPKREPMRGAFGLPEHTVIPRDQLGAAEALMEQGRIEEAELTPNFLEILDRERRYRQARKEWQQYHAWLKGRNPARAELEAKFGYDTKHAMHLVRLQRMAVEILTQERVIVRRPDRDDLLAIRDGAWSYDELIEQCQRLEEKIDKAAELSKLPEEPDDDALDELCTSIVEAVLDAQP
ncbi:MAG: hypothetical protein GY854_18620 [Deltaproteobacteria bacterium]|nr:hypothetical protein [Deltaproteobacteria bacterium]